MKQVAAVIGVGFVGRAHAEALRRLGVPIKGILGSTAERGAEMAKRLGMGLAYKSLEELAADKEVTAVHVCTPNHAHFEQCSQLLRGGKHVLCEKPLAMDSRESELLLRLAKETRGVGAVAYNLRYYPLCQEARAMVASGAIGEPRLVHGGCLQDWLLFPTDWNWRLESKLGGELRAVSDIGTHWMDLVTWITGRKITELCADLATVVPVRKKPRERVESFQKTTAAQFDDVVITTDDYASVLLHFENEMRGAMSVSQVSAGHKAQLSFEVNGTEGSLGWHSEEPNSMWVGRRDKPSELVVKDPSQQSAASRGYAAYPAGHAEGYPDTFVQLFKDFYAYLDAGDWNAERKFPTFQTGHEELMLCEVIARSQQERGWVQVAEE